MVEEEEPKPVIRPHDVIFTPPIGSFGSRPTVRDDVVELTGEANFARLEEISSDLAAEVYRYREIRQKEIAQSDEAEWLE